MLLQFQLIQPEEEVVEEEEDYETFKYHLYVAVLKFYVVFLKQVCLY